MNHIYYLLIVLYLAAAGTFAQQIKNTPVKVNTTSEDIIKEILQQYKQHNSNDSLRTTVTTRVLENGCVLESRMGQYWDGSNWVDASLELYDYNPQGQEVEKTEMFSNNGQWENSRRFFTTYHMNDLVSRYEEWMWTGSDWEESYDYVYLYDNDNRVIVHAVQQWNGSAWDSLYKYTYQYTPSGNLETEVDMTWNGTGWDNNFRYTYTFNTGDFITEKLEELWAAGEWKYNTLDVYTYNAQNQVVSDTSFWYPDTAWKANVELIYAYDGYGNINDMITKFWESEELGLQNKYHVTYEYIEGTDIKTKEENQEYDLPGSRWMNTWRIVYAYDGNNVLQKVLNEGWVGGSWVPGMQDDYTYDTNGNLDVILSQYWDGSGWVNSFKTTHAWSQLTAIETDNTQLLPQKYTLAQNYPNPFNPTTRIQYTVPKDGNVKLTVYNIIGQEIAQLVNGEVKAGTHEINFDASALTSGVYLYKLQVNNFTSVKKMILMK